MVRGRSSTGTVLLTLYREGERRRRLFTYWVGPRDYGDYGTRDPCTKPHSCLPSYRLTLPFSLLWLQLKSVPLSTLFVRSVSFVVFRNHSQVSDYSLDNPDPVFRSDTSSQPSAPSSTLTCHRTSV